MKDIIQSLAKTDDEVYAKIGTVESIDLDEKTCDVVPLDGSAKLLDVYLQADSAPGGVLQVPKVGSLVCVVFVNKETAVVANTGALERYNVKIQNVTFEMTPEGFLFQKENETLKKLIADLIKACKNMRFLVSTTGTAAAQTGQTTTLNNVAEFVAVENRFNTFLKGN